MSVNRIQYGRQNPRWPLKNKINIMLLNPHTYIRCNDTGSKVKHIDYVLATTFILLIAKNYMCLPLLNPTGQPNSIELSVNSKIKIAHTA